MKKKKKQVSKKTIQEAENRSKTFQQYTHGASVDIEHCIYKTRIGHHANRHTREKQRAIEEKESQENKISKY